MKEEKLSWPILILILFFVHLFREHEYFLLHQMSMFSWSAPVTSDYHLWMARLL